MMKLYSSPASPFVRKVRIVIHEAGKADTIEEIATAGGPLATEQMPLAENPLGKIPTLVRPDGPAVYDSRVICRYLSAHFGLDLYPESREWEILTLEATADGMLEAAVLMVYEARWRPEEMVYAPWVEAQWDKVYRALLAIEERWMPLLSGPLNIGQIATGAALGYLDFRHPGRDWRAECPSLANWYEGFSKRDSMMATIPVG